MVIRYLFPLLRDADSGDSLSQFKLGEWFYNNRHNPNYKTEAIIWFNMAANQRNPDALCCLAKCHEEGCGVILNKEKAVELYTKAAEYGSIKAKRYLAHCYLYGKLVKRDINMFFIYRSMDYSANELFTIGLCYQNGDGITQNNYKAVEYFHKAADQGHITAMYNLGLCYENGIGAEKSIVLAKQWYQRASSSNKNASLRLKEIIEQEQMQMEQLKPAPTNESSIEEKLITYTILFFISRCVLLLYASDDSWLNNTIFEIWDNNYIRNVDIITLIFLFIYYLVDDN